MTVNPTRPTVRFDGRRLEGTGIMTSVKLVRELAGVFVDDDACAQAPADAIAYRVRLHMPVPEMTPGGLSFGISELEPGLVGEEYMMTRGHFHANPDRAEYYWGIEGVGLLVLMSRDRKPTVEIVEPGSLHYIPGHTAHRLVNTGETTLRVGAAWNSDAGYDYKTIQRDGFSVRVFKRNGTTAIVHVG